MTLSVDEHRGVAERFAAELRTKAALCDSLGCTHIEVPSMSKLTAVEARALAAFLDRTGQLAEAAKLDRALAAQFRTEAARHLADVRASSERAEERRLERRTLRRTRWAFLCALLAWPAYTLGVNLGVWL